MFYPTGRFLVAAAIPVTLSLALLPLSIVGGFEEYRPLLRYSLEGILVLDALLVVLLLVDAGILPRRKRLRATRQSDSVFSVSYPHKVKLEIVVARGIWSSFRARVFDDQSADMDVEQFMHETRLRTGRNTFNYRLRVHRRGNHTLRRVYVTVYSVFGLARRVYQLPCVTTLHVYPDLKAVSRYVLLARKSHLGLIGIRRAARAGGDNEFERLRDYVTDDEIRHIDWKASAKHDRLIVRTYQMSQNQTVIFMVDCGRMMTAESYGRSMLDYTLNSVLLLARVALDQGDRVGMLAFDSKVIRYVKPASGVGHHRRLVRAGYDLFPSYEESNYEHAFQYLNAVNRKRSLVCLVTNVIDEMNAALMESYLGAIAGRHLPFAVLLQYRDIADILERAPENREQLFRQGAAAHFLLWKAEVIQKLKNRGVLALEAFPEDLDANLINEYLWIKARKLL